MHKKIDKNLRIPKDGYLILTRGDYSDYQIWGLFQAKVDLVLSDLIAEYQMVLNEEREFLTITIAGTENENAVSYKILALGTGFVHWLTSIKGYAEEVNVAEINLDIDIHDKL